MGEVIQESKLTLFTYDGVKKFKSVRRAQRRGHVGPYGNVLPKRPFNNRKGTLGRVEQTLYKELYGQLKRRYSA